jgi:error-prone DNA polymerase
VHFPAAFYTSLLNNQPMGFYHPATLVKDAQRRGVRFAPVDVQISHWDCVVEEDGTVRIGLRYVTGLREEVGKAISSSTLAPRTSTLAPSTSTLGTLGTLGTCRTLTCPKCGCDDPSLVEAGFCNQCAHQWSTEKPHAKRFPTVDDLIRRTGLRRDEVTMLAEIGALNSFGLDRRSALWQVERAVRPAGEMFEDAAIERPQPSADELSPLVAMTQDERLVADYAGTGLTIGPHPMSFRRPELSMRGILRAVDLPRERTGRRVRAAGMVITRQRPGTAKGFVFLTLEDETGISNVIVRPDLYAQERKTLVEAPFLIVEGVLQNESGVCSIRAERVLRLEGFAADSAIDSHDFH